VPCKGYHCATGQAARTSGRARPCGAQYRLFSFLGGADPIPKRHRLSASDSDRRRSRARGPARPERRGSFGRARRCSWRSTSVPFNSLHRAASKGSRRIEEVRRGAVHRPVAIRERVEATGPGPADLRRLARWRVDADAADLNVTIAHASALSASIRIAAHYAISGLFISCLPTG